MPARKRMLKGEIGRTRGEICDARFLLRALRERLGKKRLDKQDAITLVDGIDTRLERAFGVCSE